VLSNLAPAAILEFIQAPRSSLIGHPDVYPAATDEACAQCGATGTGDVSPT
jgi:hypothetical protein